MQYPEPVFNPPFNILRVGHVELTVADLARSRDFYTRVIGLVVSDDDRDTVYLRGLEEAGHHSLVLKADAGPEPLCHHIGMRVLCDEELDKAEYWFRSKGLSATWVDAPFQERTLRVVDAFGIPFEYYAKMTRVDRQILKTVHHPGGSPLRFDHMQILVPDVEPVAAFYTELGFRTSDYVVSDTGNALVGAFMHRKDIPWDLVFFSNSGPRLHHFAYVVPSAEAMLRACDAAGLHKFGRSVERGPGRHGMGHVQYVYFRDPDGHRIELVLDAPHQMLDLDNEPVEWDAARRKDTMDWGPLPSRSWFDEATSFRGIAPVEAGAKLGRATLEDVLTSKAD